MKNPSTIERAYELARSGECRSIDEIKQRLNAERHDQVEAHLAGQSIRRDLRKLCGAQRPQPQPSPEAAR